MGAGTPLREKTCQAVPPKTFPRRPHVKLRQAPRSGTEPWAEGATARRPATRPRQGSSGRGRRVSTDRSRNETLRRGHAREGKREDRRERRRRWHSRDGRDQSLTQRARKSPHQARHTTHTAGPRPGATGASGVRSPGLRAPRGLRLAQRAGPAARPRTPQSAARTPRSSSSGSETQRRKRPGALARPAAPGMQARAHLRAPAHLAPAVWPARPRAHSPGLPSSGETCSYLPWCSKGMLF